jgi:Fe-S-cluster containining protein
MAKFIFFASLVKNMDPTEPPKISQNSEANSDSKRFDKPYRFVCTKCGNCCKDPNTLVNLTYIDIIRLQKYLKLKFNELIDIIGFYIFEKELTEEQRKHLVVPPIQTQRGLAFIGLKKDQKGRCLFLDENNMCKIYDARPNICRTFPFHFHSTPFKEPKPHLKIEMSYAQKAIEYCPGIGLPSPEVNPPEWLKTGEDTITYILAENVLIQKWHEAIHAKKIEATAENYIRTALAMQETAKKPDPSKPKKKKYQQVVKQKLNEEDLN